MLQAGQPGSCGLIASRHKTFFSSPKHPDHLWKQPRLWSLGTSHFPNSEVAGVWCWLLKSSALRFILFTQITLLFSPYETDVNVCAHWRHTFFFQWIFLWWMHLVSAEYGNQRDKCMNIHTRNVIMLNTLWNWSYWL
jgi:hypothetical protein